MSEHIEFEVDHDAIVEYYVTGLYVLGLFVFLGLGSVIAWVFLNLFGGRDFLRRQVQGSRVWIEDAHLRLRHGVWHTTDTTIPLAQVGEVQITQGPMSRRQGLSRVVVRSHLQTLYATSFLLADAEAERLRDVIIRSEWT